MTVKDIALTAAAIMQADDIENAISEYDAQAELGEQPTPDADLKTLVTCVNLAVSEVNTDVPVPHTAVVYASNGLIPTDAFDDAISTVRGVTKNGKHVRFSLDTRGIQVGSDGKYEVTYTVVPSDKDLMGEVVAGAGVDKNVLGYLSARNYCLVTGRTDEASVWDQRYNAEIEKLKILRRAYIPKRKWG